ncbi:hypothetical protein C8Q75DRAFT_726427 [Abortiporus biennis]|nr:hypothetical protein C8Q75DRAFT_726427 [Abortiporus biennis]
MDVFGAVYLISTAQQFWSELEEILHIPSDITLSRLDSTLRSFINLCASYHEQYLQSPLQLEHACELLLGSELFAFHSERMCELLLDDSATTDPHAQLILYSILLSYGRRNASFLRSHKRWQPLLPLFMDHIRIEIDPDIDYTFIGANTSTTSSSSGVFPRGIGIPIEAKLRSLSVRLLYEVCRVQNLSMQDLKLFDDTFIDHLFDLVEQTREQSDETFNYSVIKFIVALNEQFMLASLHPHGSVGGEATTQSPQDSKHPEKGNRVLRVLMSRLGSSMTFGENMIFMLNRAGRTPEDRVMQLLVLKILYLLFTTKGTSEYFYTNDLCVLVDVFLREILNLDEDNESLRHTYLRVLHPLLTKTQLRSMPYKRPQIARVLESLIENENIRDVNPTTKRLVQRCLSGDWCVQFRQTALGGGRSGSEHRVDSPGLDAMSVTSAPPQPSGSLLAPRHTDQQNASSRSKGLKPSRSVENLKSKQSSHHHHKSRPGLEAIRQNQNSSSTSLPHVASAAMASPTQLTQARKRDRAGSANVEVPELSSLSLRSDVDPTPRMLDEETPLTAEPVEDEGAFRNADLQTYPSDGPKIRVVPSSLTPSSSSSLDLPLSDSGASSPISPTSFPNRSHTHSSSSGSMSPRRAAPPPPTKRRKPPAVPLKKNSRSGSVLVNSTSQPVMGSLGTARMV